MRNRQLYDRSSPTPRVAIENTLAYQVLFIDSQATPPSQKESVGCWQPPEMESLNLILIGHYLLIFKWHVLRLFLEALMVMLFLLLA